MQLLQTTTIIYFVYELAILSIATIKLAGVVDPCSLFVTDGGVEERSAGGWETHFELVIQVSAGSSAKIVTMGLCSSLHGPFHQLSQHILTGL